MDACKLKPVEQVFVSIKGIDNKQEAWELIRLFHPDESIFFVEDSMPDDINNGLLITLESDEKQDDWQATASLYLNIIHAADLHAAVQGHVTPDFSVRSEIFPSHIKMKVPELVGNRKIRCGKLLYDVLSYCFNKQLPYGSLVGVRPAKLATKCIESGLSESETGELLTKLTGMNENKASLLISVARAEQPYLSKNKQKVDLYIGIPFCATRCVYCSFTAYPVQKMKKMVRPYLDALKTELLWGSELIRQEGLSVDAIYIGGGTPTSLELSETDELLSFIDEHFDRPAEYSLEAGRPDTIDEDKLTLMKSYPITRISINPQTMNDNTLRLIGRAHSTQDVVEKFNMARDKGFDHINMDIIAGLPEEDIDMFENTLRQIEALRPDSLTVHTMAIKRASRLKEEAESYHTTDDDTVEQMIEAARQSASGMGMHPYYLYRQKNIKANLENTGYAKPGLDCLYNIHTMEETQNILAFGAGSISKFVFHNENRIERAFNAKDIHQYISRLDEMIERKRALTRSFYQS